MMMCMATTTNSRELWPAAGDWLRTQREAAGLSQRELGRLIGNSYQSVSNYERGISAPSDAACERIAALFHASSADVRERWGKYNPPSAEREAATPVLTLEDAVRADPRLLPEAKVHLLSQIGLLLRLQDVGPADREKAAAAKDADLTAKAVRALSHESHGSDTTNGGR